MAVGHLRSGWPLADADSGGPGDFAGFGENVGYDQAAPAAGCDCSSYG